MGDVVCICIEDADGSPLEGIPQFVYAQPRGSFLLQPPGARGRLRGKFVLCGYPIVLLGR